MDLEQLISCVHRRVSLWDKKDKNHHNRFILDRSWNEVAKEMKSTSILVRNKWKQLRDKFRKVNSSLPVDSSGNAVMTYDVYWPYFEQMCFLRDQFSPRETSGNFDSPEYANSPPPSSSSPAEEMQCDNKAFFEEAVESMESVGEEPSRKRKKSEDLQAALIVGEREKLQSKQKPESDDEDLYFFKSILPELKSLDKMRKITFKMEVLGLLKNHLEAQEKS